MESRKKYIVGIFSTRIQIRQKSGSNSGLFWKNIRRIGIRLWPEFPGKSENTRKNFQDFFYSLALVQRGSLIQSLSSSGVLNAPDCAAADRQAWEGDRRGEEEENILPVSQENPHSEKGYKERQSKFSPQLSSWEYWGDWSDRKTKVFECLTILFQTVTSLFHSHLCFALNMRASTIFIPCNCLSWEKKTINTGYQLG